MLLRRLGRVMVVATIAAIAGAGLCLFDAGDVVGQDSCVSFLQTTSSLLLAIPLALTGRFFPGFAAAYHLYPPDLPAPPPKA